jgi:hypothetical protein
MQTPQEMLEQQLKEIPQQILERRLAGKFRTAGLRVMKAGTTKVAEQILAGVDNIEIDGVDDALTLNITDNDIRFVETSVERFFGEHLRTAMVDAAERIADRLYKYLTEACSVEQQA